MGRIPFPPAKSCIGSPYRDSMGISLPLRNISPERDPHPPSFSYNYLFISIGSYLLSNCSPCEDGTHYPLGDLGCWESIKWHFLTFSRSTLVLIQARWERSFQDSDHWKSDRFPECQRSDQVSQATATMASGLFSRTILLANVPPVATAIFKWYWSESSIKSLIHIFHSFCSF